MLDYDFSKGDKITPICTERSSKKAKRHASRQKSSKKVRCPIGLPKKLRATKARQSQQPGGSRASSPSVGRVPPMPVGKEGISRKLTSKEFKKLNLALVLEYQSLDLSNPRRQYLSNQVLLLNEGLCCTKASNYSCRGLVHEDFVNLARTALFVAMDCFDSDKSKSFSGYACIWIRKFCSYAVSNSKMIYIPDSAQRVVKASDKLKTNGITDIEQIAAELKKEADYVINAMEMSKPVNQMPIRDDGSAMDFDALGYNEQAPEDEDQSHLNPIRKALASLDPKVAEICLKFQEGWKPAEIASLVEMTPAEVRSAYKDALVQLKEILTAEPAVEPVCEVKSVEPTPDEPAKVTRWDRIKPSLDKVRTFLGDNVRRGMDFISQRFSFGEVSEKDEAALTVTTRNNILSFERSCIEVLIQKRTTSSYERFFKLRHHAKVHTTKPSSSRGHSPPSATPTQVPVSQMEASTASVPVYALTDSS